MLDTHGFGATPRTFAMVLVQDVPPFFVTCTLPSSVPAQITSGFFGDSAMATIVVCISADELSTVTPPYSSCLCLLGSLVLRSGEMRSHVWPKLRDRKRYCDPM